MPKRGSTSQDEATGSRFMTLSVLPRTSKANSSEAKCFFEPNLVVVQSVTRSEMERAAEWLVQSGQSASLLAEGVGQDV